MDSNEGVLVIVANPKVGTGITANLDRLSSTTVSFLLARDDVTVGATGQASGEGHVQVPESKDRLIIASKPPKCHSLTVKCQYLQTVLYFCFIWILLNFWSKCYSVSTT